MDTTTTLPADLAWAVAAFCAAQGLEVNSAEAMRGECEVLSRALANALRESGLDDLCDAYQVQLWDAPEAAGELGAGHYVVRVSHMAGDYWIDVTAAQFPRLGYTGPVVREHYGW